MNVQQYGLYFIIEWVTCLSASAFRLNYSGYSISYIYASLDFTSKIETSVGWLIDVFRWTYLRSFGLGVPRMEKNNKINKKLISEE